MEILGRFVHRDRKLVGIFIPFSKNLKVGIYQIEECLGEIVVRYIGKPAMEEQKLENTSLEDIYLNKDTTLMTSKEIGETHENT